MKIAVISQPRTGSSKLVMVLSSIYQVTNLSEVLTSADTPDQKINKIEDLKSKNDYAVKFHKRHLSGIDINSVPWTNFDIIISIYRKSLVDAFVSTHIAMKRNVWERWSSDPCDVEEVTIDPMLIRPWYDRTYSTYGSMLRQIQEISGKKIFEFEYDEIGDDLKLLQKFKEYDFPVWDLGLDAATIPTGINYKEKCLNYREIESKFKELDLKYISLKDLNTI